MFKRVGTLSLLLWLFLFCTTQAAPDIESLFLNIEGIDYEVTLEKSGLKEQTQIVSDNQNSNIEIDIELFRGKVIDQPSSWLTVSYYNDSWQGLVFLNNKLYEIDGLNFGIQMTDQGAIPITSILSTELALTGDFDIKKMCATPHIEDAVMAENALAEILPNQNSGQLNNVALAVGGINSVANVVLALDHFYLATHGGQSASIARAMQILNNVDGFYRNSLGIALNNVAIQTFSTAAEFNTALGLPATQADILNANTLLNGIFTFQANIFGNNDRTVGSLLTSRDLEVNDPLIANGVAGIAPLDAICVSQDGLNLAVSVNEDRGGLGVVSVILAHEMGHNFGSCHDGDAASASCPVSSLACSATGQTIMTPFVNPLATAFSQCSKDNIAGHLLGKTCLKEPIDIALAKAGAAPPDNLSVAQTITRQVLVSNNGSVPVANVRIDGNIDNVLLAKYINVSADTQACTLQAAGQNYQCNIASINAAGNVTVTETIQVVSLGTFNFSSTFNNQMPTQRVDIVADNQQVDDTRTANQAVAAPNAPSGLSASAQTTGNIVLSWNDNSNNEQNFQVQRSENGGAFLNTQNGLLEPNVETYTDNYTDLQAGTEYTYQVLAINSIATVASNQATATALERTVTSATASDNGGGGGGGTFYLLPMLMLLIRLVINNKQLF